MSSWLRVAERISASVAMGASTLGEGDLRKLLRHSGIRFGPSVGVTSPSDAAAKAAQVGFPVVLKALVPGVLHKTERGLVRTDLNTPAAVGQAAQELQAAAVEAGAANPVLSLQSQLSGIELAIGARRDLLGS